MAWFKNPLPGTPFNSDVIGIKDIEITSGSVWTVLSHSLWEIKSLSFPPLRLGIITRSWKVNKNVCHQRQPTNISPILCTNNNKHYDHKALYLIRRVRIQWTGLYKSQLLLSGIVLYSTQQWKSEIVIVCFSLPSKYFSTGTTMSHAHRSVCMHHI